MSQGLYPSPTGLTLALLSDDRFPVSLGFEDIVDCCSSEGQSKTSNKIYNPAVTSSSSVLENPGYISCQGKDEGSKVEEWQLVPDEVLIYLTGGEYTDTRLNDQCFFQKVASELRFCLEKIEEIKQCYGYNNKRCDFVEQPSRESSPISWNSQHPVSFDGDVFALPQTPSLNSLLEAHPEGQTIENDQQSDDSSDFSSITSTDCALSSYEPVNSPLEQSDRTEVSDTHQPLRPQELLAPYADDDKEAMLFSLVQDLSLESPCWVDTTNTSGAPEDKNGALEIVDQQPQSIQSDENVPSKPSSQGTGTSGYITISYTDSPDSSESRASCPLSQAEEGTETRLIFDEICDFQDCLVGASNGDHNRTNDNFLNKMDGEKSSNPKEVRVDEVTFTNAWADQAANKPTDSSAVTKKETRQKKWWSMEEDKRDINLLKLPAVSSEGLVFHANESGAVKVGEGSFGTVYLADLYTHAAVYKVVVKDFSPKGVTKPSEILEEARVLLHLSDTMFVPFFYGVLPVASSQQYALVQEFFAEGMSLHNLIEDKSRRLSQISWISICVQMTVGLDRFHRKGILMNDIKKDNILVECRSEECVLKYIDMGLASYKVGRVFYGSEDYMKQFSHLAPEVRRLEKTSPASDVYSIGKILLSIAKHAPLRIIRDFISPCMSFSPADRPAIREVICKLLTVRDDIYSGDPVDSSRPVMGRRWFC